VRSVVEETTAHLIPVFNGRAEVGTYVIAERLAALLSVDHLRIGSRWAPLPAFPLPDSAT
jgi:hypothetical protein